ncbi:PREDICTED: HIV Tat-specific factor 1 homolog [Priapulus caudatus]|uniref:HIV Tat-specific factor 1 homolog n=1 Tax=Priapulus caudatus TaxID=37621 RepID=A0ABM1DZ20_PRICU|nr:PREDICTED: HIV Tat-specific factor 1 homolog [Priapulus caudatus]
MSDNEDFEEQIRLEQLGPESGADPGKAKSYTDKDGTEYEWDPKRKAYFPKIDTDFIAQYQANYGVETDFSQLPAATKEHQEYWAQYRQWQSQFYGENKKDAADKGKGKEGKGKKKDGKNSKDSGEKELGLLEKAEEDYAKESSEYSHEDFFYWYCTCSEEERNEWYSSLTEQQKRDHWDYYNQHYEQYAAGLTNEGQGENKEKGGDEQTEDSSKKESGSTKQGAKKKQESTWFDVSENKNTNVYVSNLPLSTTEDNFIQLMSKYGLILHDPQTGKPKVKLYKDEEGHFKGDALCCYFKIESVQLAEQLLDDSEYKGKKLKVEQARFQLKGSYNPALKRKRRKQDKQKMEKLKEKLLDWRPDKMRGERSKHEKVIVVKNMFDNKDFEKDATLILGLKQDLRDECSKYGEVKKVEIYDRHPEGIATVMFKEVEDADQALLTLHGRWFAKRKITAATWDGKEKFKVEETEEEKAKRLKGWDSFLEIDANSASVANSETQKEADELSSAGGGSKKADPEKSKLSSTDDHTEVESKPPDTVSPPDASENEKTIPEHLPADQAQSADLQEKVAPPDETKQIVDSAMETT